MGILGEKMFLNPCPKDYSASSIRKFQVLITFITVTALKLRFKNCLVWFILISVYRKHEANENETHPNSKLWNQTSMNLRK